jgi:AcrR family transcriptional regulator
MARRKDHTRDELKQMALDAAITIANQQGLAALTAREVARAIGYTVGTLYNVFKNFDDLILHVNARTMDELEQMFSQTVSKAKDSWQTVYALTKAYIDFSHDHAACWRLLFEPRDTKQPAPDWYQEKIDKLFNIVQHALLPLLNNSSQRAHMAAKVLWSALYGLCALSLNEKIDTVLHVPTQELAQSLVKNYLTGLVNESTVCA